MPSSLQLRRLVRLAFTGMLLPSATTIVLAQPAYGHRAGVALRAPISQARPAPGPGPSPGARPGPKKNQEHLAQRMERHSNLPLAAQQRALENEAGFRDLPETTQQRMRDRLT